MPSGPAIPEEPKLALFCVLSPDLPAQTVLLQRTLTYKEAMALSNPDLNISGARIVLEGPEGRTEAVPMLPGDAPSDLQERKHDSDFLWGSGHFNYLIQGEKLNANEVYRLLIDTDAYGSIQAETTVPGPFEITEINTEPDLSNETFWYDSSFFGRYDEAIKEFRVTWTESQGASGYLVDVVLLRYDLSEWIRTWDLPDKEGEAWAEELYFPDSVDVVEAPYEEVPLRFPTVHGEFMRGFLTHDLKCEMAIDDLYDRIPDANFYMSPADPEGLYYYYYYRLRITIQALSPSLFAFTAFQYLNLEEDQIVGQEVDLPDLSNVEGGVGVFGAVAAQTGYSRIFKSDGVDLGNRWRPQDVFDGTPQNLQPEDGAVLDSGESLVLSWDPVSEATLYMVVLKPYYLWFFPGNHVYLVRDPRVEIFARDFPYRDCRVQWYVRAIKENPLDPSFLEWLERTAEEDSVFFSEPHDVYALGPGKGPFDLYGYYINGDWYQNIGDQGFEGGMAGIQSHSCSRWSETRFITLPSGEMEGFEESRPAAEAPPEGGSLSPNGTFVWHPVEGADAYLVYMHSNNHTVIAVSKDPRIFPPFPESSEWAEGLLGLESFEIGETCTWQVCGLRVKSGALGFVVHLPESGGLPVVYPRYQHPSGIMLQSRWSEERRFIVE